MRQGDLVLAIGWLEVNQRRRTLHLLKNLGEFTFGGLKP